MCARGQRTASGTMSRQMKQPQHMRQNGTMALSQQTGTCGEEERGAVLSVPTPHGLRLEISGSKGVGVQLLHARG